MSGISPIGATRENSSLSLSGSGGRGQWFRRYAWLGGIIVFWIKRALRAGYYRDAVRLAVSGLPMIVAIVVQRSIAWIRGRRPVETLDLHLECSFSSEEKWGRP